MRGDACCIKTPKDAAIQWGVGLSTVYRWIESGQIKADKSKNGYIIPDFAEPPVTRCRGYLDGYFSVKHAAVYYGVSEQTIYSKVRRGKMESEIVNGKVFVKIK